MFNAAVVRHNGLFHMLYRAQGIDYVSSDGFDWLRLDKPVFSPEGEYETRGWRILVSLRSGTPFTCSTPAIPSTDPGSA